MLFSSAIFIFLFLPVFLILYFAFPSRLRNLIMMLASLLFYSWGEQQIVLVLLASTIADYAFARLIETGYRKTGLVLSLLTNLGFLAFFKYFNFGFENYKALLQLLHLSTAGLEHVPNIALPIGISFYTFQTLSYTIDVYRGQVKASHHFIDYAAYVTMFPQLVAGPIVRYIDIEKQLRNKDISLQNFSLGFQRFIIGLAKKMLLANSFAEIADAVYALPIDDVSTLWAWMAAISYAFQIYFDFSAYSDMAIGLGRMTGFHFLENFNYPYIAKSVREFWQRWHMSLSYWFRDYLYISLGGNRISKSRTYLNLFIVFLATGLWHGASWNFVVWGLFHGLFIIVEHAGFGKILKKAPAFLSHTYTLLIWVVSMVFFRSLDLSSSVDFLGKMFSLQTGNAAITAYYLNFYFDFETYVLLIIAVLLSMPTYAFVELKLEALANNNSTYSFLLQGLKLTFIAYLFISSVSYIAAGSYNPFIYFRF